MLQAHTHNSNDEHVIVVNESYTRIVFRSLTTLAAIAV
jgi:hypothetical protein